MKKIFIYKIEIFGDEIVFCVGVKAKDVSEWLKKNNGKKNIIKLFNRKETIEEFDELSKSPGFVREYDEPDVHLCLVYLKDYNFMEDELDILNHEIVHLRQFLFKHKDIKEEIEFEAYFQQNVFRELRHKLNKYLKK
jgi:hypothetical protein